MGRWAVPNIQFFAPLDQPFGVRRGLDWIEQGLKNNAYTSLRIAVAYAKEAPLLRLEQAITAFSARGGEVDAIFGIDQVGTSV